MANPSGSRAHNAAQAFDVSVLAFPAASSRTVQGLMQLFSIDEPSAQRLIASVPLRLTQQVTAAEAEACAQALRMLGARVVLEPTPLPTAQHARWEQPGGYEEDLLPQPRLPVAHNDNGAAEQVPWDAAGLEYDMLASHEAGYAAEAAISVAPSMRSPLDLELGVNEPDRMAEDRALRRPRQDAIDLLPGHDPSPGLELAAASTSTREPQRERTVTSARTRTEQRTQTEQRTRTEERTPQPEARAQARTGPTPHGRAAVVEPPPPSVTSQTTHLLRVLFAFAIAAIGYWADSSVIFGSAGLWSVAAHGVALYQLVLGVRGLVT